MPINRLCARRHPRRALTGPPIHAALPAALAPTALAKNDLQALSLEDLMSVAVASVSGKAEPLQDGATAVFVLTQDDLKQSGATSISDALRKVSRLHFARIDATRWAVSERFAWGIAATPCQPRDKPDDDIRSNYHPR